MIASTGRRDGHYDENGDWKREKICFISCGDRCTCSPPGGIWHIDITEKDENSKDNEDYQI
jgi:hypothetical protein